MNSVSGRIRSVRFEDGQAVAAGQLDVAQDDVRLERFDQGQGLGHVRGRRHFEVLALEELLERRGDHLLVVDDQDPTPRG